MRNATLVRAGEADLVSLVRDPAKTARLAVIRQWNEYVGRDMFECHVRTGDILWSLCSTGHTSEETAARCVMRKVRSNWRKMRNAPEVDLVNGGATIECRWPNDRGGCTYGRESAYHLPEHATLIDYGPVG